MGEKSSELENTNKTDLTSDDNLLEIRRQDRSLSEVKIDDAAIDEADTPDDTRQIREQIEETRSQMSETIDAIQEKLSIANITEQVKEQVSEQIGDVVETAKDAVYGKASDVAKSVGRSFAQIGNSDLARKAKENPWLVSVVGMGIGAVLVGILSGDNKKKRRKNSHRYENFAVGYTADEAEYDDRLFRKSKIGKSKTANHQTSQNNEDEAATKAAQQSGAVSATFATVSNAAGSAYETVGGAAGKTYETVGKASSFAYEKAGDIGKEMKKNYEHYIEENPLVVGAVAFAVGAAIGYAIPSTKVENQYLGEMRDNVLNKAQSSAQDAIGTVKQVVGEAQQIIVDEVKAQTAS